MNVTASQLLNIRAGVAELGAEVLVGKNSLMRRAVQELKEEMPSLQQLKKHLYNGAGLIFTNGNFKGIKDVIDANCLGSAAKVGAIAPCDVTLYPQRTSMSPNDIKMLHALNIQCKIFKGTIEITGEKQLIWAGQRVGASEANILNILGIMPFKYTLKIEALFDNGNMYDPCILSITDQVLAEKFNSGLRKVAGLSLAVGYPCAASAPHLIGGAFKDIAAIAIAIEHNMKQIEDLQKLLSDPEALAAAAKAAAASAPAGGAAPAAQEEPVQEEAAAPLDLGDMFDF
ncbi:ribosomal protein L10, putative [Trichomonas vaginalis G3]|uniref:60S acidic ribosomal protein P0 n=1 Tax=Trichomonas vaginalis (strain ATCC PRA-98 / G3) TaxID=412133 RepID=A2DHM5_TRIV3|nr:ribosome biogenesis [Trichomonas vaginalis G3]EAY20073.1 ribosomal protein L10, putative [Trichomonas vaginalis G3]KAI5528026.1 ribosome biogenesis [Trichomonas vaginalis G3]|eukprot:XP_001581059.1 ribosomal protein L10 [Trichomonas vaginalis G3]